MKRNRSKSFVLIPIKPFLMTLGVVLVLTLLQGRPVVATQDSWRDIQDDSVSWINGQAIRTFACLDKPGAYRLEMRTGNSWQPLASSKARQDLSECTVLNPYLVRYEFNLEVSSMSVSKNLLQISLRQKSKKHSYSASKIVTAGNLKAAPVADLSSFVSRYGSSVTTIICDNPARGGGQGTAFAVRVNLGPEAIARGYGSTFLVTAEHVIRECFYSDYQTVTVLYQGQKYSGYVWNVSKTEDLATILTSAPVPAAELAKFREDRPAIGDIGISISSAGGLPGTVTQGVVSGVSNELINAVIPSGQGASGGPVFNTSGKVIGVVVRGNFALTQLTALPQFCNVVYGSPCPIFWS